MRLEENIHGFKKAEKLAKKNGWKIVKTIPANASESRRRARRFNESNDQEKEFSYKGVVITRYDYESLPMPMAASKLDDETMQKIAEDIYYMLLDHGWEDKDIDRYLGRNLDELEDENDRDANMIKEDFWEYMENAAVANGMEYYSEMEDDDEYMESRKFGKKFAKESIDADPALVCPYCGGDNCEVSIGSDDLNFTNLDRLQGETFNVECWCNDCDKPYNVTVELNVKDVYPNEDADKLSSDWA